MVSMSSTNYAKLFAKMITMAIPVIIEKFDGTAASKKGRRKAHGFEERDITEHYSSHMK
jgi:hypothetical protein